MLRFFKKNKKEPANIKEVFGFLKNLEGDIEKLFQEIEEIKEKNKFSVQKLGIVRFNPFSEVGGDQSFSIALLDENNDGLVITSLYNRGGNRLYGKPIKVGSSQYSLSQEEKKAIELAKNHEKEKSKLNLPATNSGSHGSY